MSKTFYESNAVPLLEDSTLELNLKCYSVFNNEFKLLKEVSNVISRISIDDRSAVSKLFFDATQKKIDELTSKLNEYYKALFAKYSEGV